MGEHGGTRSEEDGAVKVSDSDLWKETRLGAPVAGGVWDRVQGQRTRGGGGLRQDSEAGEGGGAHGHSKEGNREGEGDDDEAADGGSNASERGEMMERNKVRNDDMNAGEQEYDCDGS